MVWARGLNQLVRARNIHTIGDISTLTPLEVQSLPIRQPKVTTLKKALEMFHNQQESKRLKQTSGSKMEATESLAAASHEAKTEETADLEPAKEREQVTDQPEFTKEKDQEPAVPETPEKMDHGLPPPEPMEKDDGLAQPEPTEEDLGSTKLEATEGRDSGPAAVESTEKLDCGSSQPEPTEKDNILLRQESTEERAVEPKEKENGSTQPEPTEDYGLTQPDSTEDCGSTKPMEGHDSTQPEPSQIPHGSTPPEPTENRDHGSIQPDSTEDHGSKDPTEERAQLSPVVDLTKDSNNERSPLLPPTPETDPVPAVVDLTDEMEQPSTSVQPIMTHVSHSAQPSETDQAPTTVQPTEAREEGVQQLDFDGVAAINDFVDDTSVPSSVESSPIRGALPYFPIFSSGAAGMNTEGLDVESILENVNVASAATSLEVDALSESTDMFSTAAEVGSPVVEMLRELVSMDADNVARETNAMATQPFEVTLQLSSREMSVVETLSAVNERIMRGELSGLPSSQISAVHQMLNRMMMMAVSELQTRCVSPRQQNRKQ
ncbi:PREDICTED: proteoglycan 4-like [Branchiostoma belcheri]|uniref:Proteoglycan 4-like n=1 Tax=Branchiostoma belcheri TaxID=7741 RepID=A0A6P4Z0E5_BRABE|nr:PREDICTED: proteoglycan 4-like [Branchiostoma belcheri]